MRLLILFLFFSTLLRAQLTDDFSDGDFTENPAWTGNSENFTVNDDDELQLFDEDPVSNQSYLSTPAATSSATTTTWEFYVRQEFSASASNFSRVYLSASSPDLTAPQFGYFVKIGGISGSDDALELVRQDGNATEVIATATPGAVGGSTAEARVRVVRTGANWQLFADYSAGTDYALEATATDDTYPTGGFIGVRAAYTVTRAEDFYFDDFFVDPLFVDVVPPTLLSAGALEADEILLQFDEPLDEDAAADPANYSIDNGITVAEAVFDPTGPTEVILLTGQSLSSGTTYTVTATGIEDAEGNAAAAQTAQFTFFEVAVAQRFDVLIHEIMADPNPPVELPDAEYVELFNAGDQNFNLAGWTLDNGSNEGELPDYILQPGDYVILTNFTAQAAFEPYGEVIGMNLPALSNSGDDISLRNADGTEIHEVNYDLTWYRNSSKDDGGFSLEMINPLAVCAGSENWRASASLLGGTPGAVNSITDPMADTAGPELLAVFPSGANSIELTFSEIIDAATAIPENFELREDGSDIVLSSVTATGDRTVRIILSENLQPQTIYEIRVATGLTDCLGNPIAAGAELEFGLPEAIEERDIVLNEILFNAATGGDRYVELYNRSNKIFNLADLSIAAVYNNGDSSIIEPIEVPFLIVPGAYVVLTEDRNDVLERYEVAAPRNLVQTNLPPINDREGNLTIFTEQPTGQPLIVDAFDYTRDYFVPLLDDQNGVALERIDPDAPTNNGDNWHAAAEEVGFGTPTARNSQFRENPPTELADFFTLSSTTVSPDGDGFEDFVLLDYRTDAPDYLVNIRIFDAAGREVRMLARNQLLATEGFLQWDGTTDRGDRARIGLHVIWIEYFLPDGSVNVEKEVVVVAARL